MARDRGVTPTVVVSDERSDPGSGAAIELERWSTLATAVLVDEARGGELTLTFVDRDEIHDLNREHMGVDAPTDVLSFPLDDAGSAGDAPSADDIVPVLLGDVVICPSVAAENAPTHTGSLDDELALLVVHGILHLLGHDHAGPDDTAEMQARELRHLEAHHWAGAAPSGFSLVHRDA